MHTPKKHHIKSESNSYHYLLFDSVGSFTAFVDAETEKLTTANAARWKSVLHQTQQHVEKGSDWYGTPPASSIPELEQHHSFLGMQLLKKLQPKIKNYLHPYLEHLNAHVIPKPKIAYNDRGLGMFSFERAAMGLFRLGSINLKTPLERTTTQLHIELGKTRTTTKKVYAFFKDKKTAYPSLQLYLMAGANANIKGNEMLYAGLACSELVEFLEARGVAVAVSVLMGTSFENRVVMGVVCVKRFQDKMDKNQLLLLSCDPRYFRFRGFKSLIALSNYFGYTIPSGLGKITTNMGTDFVKALQKKGFVFEQSYSLEAATKEVTRIINTYKKAINNDKAA